MYIEGIIFVRHSLKSPFVSRDFKGDGSDCPACRGVIGREDDAVLVPLGPGDDVEVRDKAWRGGWFNAVAIQVHKACALGERNGAA